MRCCVVSYAGLVRRMKRCDNDLIFDGDWRERKRNLDYFSFNKSSNENECNVAVQYDCEDQYMCRNGREERKARSSNYMLAVWWLCSASQTDKAYDYRGCIKIPQFYVIALEYRGTLQMEEWQVSIISCSWYAIGVDKCGQVRSGGCESSTIPHV